MTYVKEDNTTDFEVVKKKLSTILCFSIAYHEMAIINLFDFLNLTWWFTKVPKQEYDNFVWHSSDGRVQLWKNLPLKYQINIVKKLLKELEKHKNKIL